MRNFPLGAQNCPDLYELVRILQIGSPPLYRFLPSCMGITEMVTVRAQREKVSEGIGENDSGLSTSRIPVTSLKIS